MYWVLQNDLHDESLVMPWVIRPSDQGFMELLRVLETAGIPHSLHKVVPLVGELEPDIDPPNPVICIGSYSMRHVAARRGWVPGTFTNENFDFQVWREHWGKELLNYDASVHRFSEVPEQTDEFFIRPVEDSKAFSGEVTTWEKFAEWQHRVVNLGEKVGTTLDGDTVVLVSKPRNIQREYRLWIVDGRVVAQSQYKIGNRVQYDQMVDPFVVDYGLRVSQRWQPDRAFVLDVALVDGIYRIIEVNSLGAAGFYHANIGRIVEALEGMGY